MNHQLTITLPQRAYDGLVEAGIRNNLTTAELASQILQQSAYNYADLFRIGVLTSAAFVARFTPAEFGSILATAQENPSVGQLVTELTSSAYVALDDPRLEPGLQMLVEEGLLTAERVPEILSYARPGAQPTALTVGQTWTDANGQEWVVVQATNPDGTFAADDPETPERESLTWVLVDNDTTPEGEE
jgi:hypothetical protein